jgi:hypothetical protein
VSVLLGNGDGTFQAPQVLTAPNLDADSVAVADFNRDGNLDIVTANFDGTVTVFPGNGNGTFQTPLNFPSGANDPFALAVADFNGDGFPDLAVVDAYIIGFASANTVQVLVNSTTWPAGATTPTSSVLTVSVGQAVLPGTINAWLTSADPTVRASVLTVSVGQAALPGTTNAWLTSADPTVRAGVAPGRLIPDPTEVAAADLLFALRSVRDPMALWSGSPPQALDGWRDAALSDTFPEPFGDGKEHGAFGGKTSIVQGLARPRLFKG